MSEIENIFSKEEKISIVSERKDFKNRIETILAKSPSRMNFESFDSLIGAEINGIENMLSETDKHISNSYKTAKALEDICEKTQLKSAAKELNEAMENYKNIIKSLLVEISYMSVVQYFLKKEKDILFKLLTEVRDIEFEGKKQEMEIKVLEKLESMYKTQLDAKELMIQNLINKILNISEESVSEKEIKLVSHLLPPPKPKIEPIEEPSAVEEPVKEEEEVYI